MTALLEVEDLRVTIPTSHGELRAVDGVSFTVEAGRTLCLVGESGCGKSMTALALMGLQPPRARRTAKRLVFEGHDLLALPPERLNRLRGDRMAMIFQEPMTSLNPVFRIGDQMMDVHLQHRRASRREARERALYLLERVGVSDPRSRLAQYPHELSGGIRQRVMIAMALMCGPVLIIADEPTTALDVTIQAELLRLLEELKAEFRMAMIFITHDLGVVSRMADTVAVMYAGEIVEQGGVEQIFDDPLHVYTRGLLSCLPEVARRDAQSRLPTIAGVVPALTQVFAGCRFAPRCHAAEARCQAPPPLLEEIGPAHRVRCVHPPERLRALDIRGGT